MEQYQVVPSGCATSILARDIQAALPNDTAHLKEELLIDWDIKTSVHINMPEEKNQCLASQGLHLSTRLATDKWHHHAGTYCGGA